MTLTNFKKWESQTCIIFSRSYFRTVVAVYWCKFKNTTSFDNPYPCYWNKWGFKWKEAIKYWKPEKHEIRGTINLMLNIWFELYHKIIDRSVRIIHEKFSNFCSNYGLVYIDNGKIRRVHFYQEIIKGSFLYFCYNQIKKVLYPHPSQTFT